MSTQRSSFTISCEFFKSENFSFLYSEVFEDGKQNKSKENNFKCLVLSKRIVKKRNGQGKNVE